jgi:pimeloyl-ACP methyl ester carboxylesterase
MEPVPDAEGKVFPLVVIHGITGSVEAFEQTVNKSLAGTSSTAVRSILDLMAGEGDRSVIAGLPHTQVYSFEYTTDSLRWFTNSASGSQSVGARFAGVIDCLFDKHGVQVMVLAHSMGGLVTRWAANQTLGPDGQPKIGKVVTLGTPYLGSMSAAVAGTTIDAASTVATIKGVPWLAALTWWCGRQGTNTGNSTAIDCGPLSSLTSEAGRALQAGSSEISALSKWPDVVDVSALAGSTYIEGSLFGARTPRLEIGDVIVGLNSATADADETFIETCDPFSDESPLWIRFIKSISGTDEYAQRIDKLAKVIFELPCYHGLLMASLKQAGDILGEFNDWITARSAARLSLDSCEGLDGTLVSAKISQSVCAAGWALVESTDCCFDSKARSIVDLIQFNADTTRVSRQLVAASWSDIQEGPSVSGYTIQSIVEKGVPEPVARLLFDELTACRGCRPSLWTFGDFYEIPQLGSEPVRGSGCNIAGDVIPDGWWFGTYDGMAGGSINFDVACIYLGAKAKELHENCNSSWEVGDNCWSQEAFLVNANARTRTIPVSTNHVAENDAPCRDTQISSLPDNLKWILVQQGQLVYTRHQCDSG